MPIATIMRRNNRLAIGWDDGEQRDRSGDYPATPDGLAELKRDLKNDSNTSAEDHDAIDALELPADNGDRWSHGADVKLTGDPDPDGLDR